MRVIIAGGHGQIALRLERLLAAGGHTAVGLVRNPVHRADLESAGAEAVVCDLEKANVDEVAGHLRDADAAVFAAGAGPGSGAARKETMDRAGAVLFAKAAEQADVRRHIQISSMSAGRPPDGTGGVFASYLVAKGTAEDDLRSRDLDWTIVRPGRLTDEPGTGRVRLAPPPVTRGDVPRDDVAAVVAELLLQGTGFRRTLELVQGEEPVAKAVGNLGLS